MPTEIVWLSSKADCETDLMTLDYFSSSSVPGLVRPLVTEILVWLWRQDKADLIIEAPEENAVFHAA